MSEPVDPNTGAIVLASAAAAAKEVAGKAYCDAAEPTLKEAGTLAARTFRALTIPLRAVLAGIEGIQEKIAERAARKLPRDSAVPLLPAPANIALPIILDYAMLGPDEAEQEVLRDLFAGLLASSIDPATAEHVHRAFRGIIGQITALEACIFRAAGSKKAWAAIQMQELVPPPPNADAFFDEHFPRGALFSLGADLCSDRHLHDRCITNLARLGLVSIEWSAVISVQGVYLPLIGRMKAIPEFKDKRMRHVEGAVIVTEFGRAFYSVCSRPDLT